MSTLDYKWWARSYRRQRLIRDMAQEKIELYIAGKIELSDVERDELAAIFTELTKKLMQRKRPPGAGDQWRDGRWRFKTTKVS